MFQTLNELAKKATLMITIAAEGDGQLRVNVTPMPFDPKAKSNLPQPLSLLATPTEFDADFATALSTWQAPRRSLVQQAQDAAGGAAPAASAPALPAPKADAKNDKPGRKTRGTKTGDDEKKDAVPEAVAAAGEAVAAADQVMGATASPDGDEKLPANAGAPDAAAAAQADGESAGADVDAHTPPATAHDIADPAPAVAQNAASTPPATEVDDSIDTRTLDLF